MSVVVLAPHPDDETLGCGGRLRLAADRGERTVVVFLTSGQAGIHGTAPGAAGRLREKEAEAAAEVLGVARTVHLRGPDGALADAADDLAAPLRAVLEEEAPQVVLLPHEADAHPDHSAAWGLLAAALPPGMAPLLPTYEVWTPLEWFDEVVDVSAVMPAKLAALRCHASQLARYRFDDAAEGLARYRGALAGGCAYAEVFAHRVPEGRRQGSGHA